MPQTPYQKMAHQNYGFEEAYGKTQIGVEMLEDDHASLSQKSRQINLRLDQIRSNTKDLRLDRSSSALPRLLNSPKHC